MTDDADEVGEIEVDTTAASDLVEVENGYIIAPRGFEDVQDHFGCPLIRVNMKAPGSVDVLVSSDGGETWQWKSVDKIKRSAVVTLLKT